MLYDDVRLYGDGRLYDRGGKYGGGQARRRRRTGQAADRAGKALYRRAVRSPRRAYGAAVRGCSVCGEAAPFRPLCSLDAPSPLPLRLFSGFRSSLSYSRIPAVGRHPAGTWGAARPPGGGIHTGHPPSFFRKKDRLTRGLRANGREEGQNLEKSSLRRWNNWGEGCSGTLPNLATFRPVFCQRWQHFRWRKRR